MKWFLYTVIFFCQQNEISLIIHCFLLRQFFSKSSTLFDPRNLSVLTLQPAELGCTLKYKYGYLTKIIHQKLRVRSIARKKAGSEPKQINQKFYLVCHMTYKLLIIWRYNNLKIQSYIEDLKKSLSGFRLAKNKTKIILWCYT